jgi:hypothetical protein
MKHNIEPLQGCTPRRQSGCYSSSAACGGEGSAARFTPLDVSTSVMASSSESLLSEQVATWVWPSLCTGARLWSEWLSHDD